MTKLHGNTQLDDLKELFNARIVQDKLANISDMPFSFMDLDGIWIGKPSKQNFSIFKLVNANEVGKKKCLECDRKYKDIALASGRAVKYVSQTGLTNFAVPIEINGKYMGVIIGGQVLLGEIDDSMRKTFEDIAKYFRIDEREILTAAKEIQISKISDLNKAIIMIEEMVPYICELELEKVNQKTLLRKTIQDQIAMTDFVKELERYLNSNKFELSVLLLKTRDKIVELVGAKHGCLLGSDEDANLTNLQLCKRINDAKYCKERMVGKMVSDAFKNHNIIVCPDIRKDERYNSEEGWPDAISYLVIPVPDEHGGITCILTLSSGEPNAFGSREIILAKRFATLTALVLNDARRMIKLKEKNKYLTLLLDVIVNLNNEPTEKDTIFKRIVELTSDTFCTDECSILTLDEDSKKIILRASLNNLNENAEQVLSYEIGKGIAGTIVHTGELIRTKNVQKHTAYSGKYQTYMRQKKPNWKCHSLLGIPLIRGNKCIGVIQLHNRRKTDDHPYNWFSKEDERLLSALGDIIVFIIDKASIVSEKEATNKLHLSEKMAAIANHTAGTTHGFKQPMQIIKNQVELIKGKKTLEGCTEEIDTIDNQIHRMYEIINIFSRFSSPEIKDNIAVKELLDQTIETMKLPVNININQEVSYAPKIDCDPGQIKQVFENLILNGCEAMSSGGDIKISAFTNKGKISIVFVDEGEGIPGYAIEKVFDPFFTKKSTGTGLGLYISRFIVQNHKGSIYIKSGESKGSIFVVELPASNHRQKV